MEAWPLLIQLWITVSGGSPKGVKVTCKLLQKQVLGNCMAPAHTRKLPHI